MATKQRPKFAGRKSLVCAAAASLYSGMAGAAQVTLLGPPILVSDPTENRAQSAPSIASDANGDFVVAWELQYSETDSDIYARRFFANGQPNGPLIPVFTTGILERSPAVAMDPAGNFVIVADKGGDIAAQLYSSSGALVKSIFPVNPKTPGAQGSPAVAMHPSGGFVVAWEDHVAAQSQSYIQGFAPGGTALSPSSTSFSALQPSVAFMPDGRVAFVATTNDFSGIFGNFCNSAVCNGTHTIDLTTTTTASSPFAAANASGDLVVAWRQSDGLHGTSVAASSFGGPDVTLSQSGSTPIIAVDPDGSFALAYRSTGILLERFDASGVSQGSAKQLRGAMTTGGAGGDPSVAVDADGDMVVAWSDSVPTGTLQVYVRRIQGPEDVDLAVAQSAAPATSPTGSPLAFTLTASNLHPEASEGSFPAIDAAFGSARNVRLVDVLPDGVSDASASGSNWTCGITNGKVSCLYGLPLRAGDQAPPVTVSFTPPNTPGEQLDNIAKVSADQLDTHPGNNRAEEHTRLVCPDSVVELSASAYTVSESAANLTVTATRSGGTCGPVQVHYDTSGSSALPGSDFTDVTGVLTWADGDTVNKTFQVPIVADALDEINEKFAIALGGISGGVLGPRSTARATITDDDASPRVNFTTRAQAASEADGLRSVTLALSELSGRDVTIPLNVGGTATATSDYFAGASTITIPAGQAQASFQVEIVDDGVHENTETLAFTIGTPGGATVGSISTHTITIADDDAASALPSASFGATTSSGSEAQDRTFTVSLSAASASTVTVPFTLAGTATVVDDYTIDRSSPLSFPAGTTSVTIGFHPIDDTVHEGNETTKFTLGAPSGATLGAVTVHTHTIVDND